MKYFIFAIFLFMGCSTATARHPVQDANGFMHSFDVQRCQSLLDQRDALSWGIAFATGLTAGGALGTAGVDTGDESKDKRIKWGLGITTSVLGAAASSMMVLVKLKSTSFEQYCNQPPTNVTVTKEAPVEKLEDPITPIPDAYAGDAGIE
jgi:hypothetical protein